ncbi:glycerophosphodiester phosphodiesterase 1-like [Physella acuta]|uniref:glycerophosphodiester phosphodiesterase 1-like n=1 Tax=Physella acuta TaxID=109671 RepID=UPI0027DE5C2A|nr:glycerophosphodiester phosphodiesterase 1-like [Physella acuta]
MSLSQKTIILLGNVVLLWMLISTLVVSTFWISASLTIVLAGVVKYFRIKPVPKSRTSERVRNLFEFDAENHKNNTIFHKAGGLHAPENTLEAIAQAVKLGIPSIEVDLDFTKDDIGVLIHGPKVNDTTDGSGFVSDFTFEELQKLNAAAKFANRNGFTAVRIPTLEACLEMCIQHKLVVFIDCKSNPEQTAKLISRLYKKYPDLYELGIVCSFYPSIIYAVRKADPAILTGLTHRNYILSLLGNGSERNNELWKKFVSPWLDIALAWSHWAILWYICGNSFFLCCKDNVCLDNKKFWDSLGVTLVAWTVNDVAEKQFFLKSLKVPIITDGLHEL